MITTVLCYSATPVADCGKPCRVDMGNVGQKSSYRAGYNLVRLARLAQSPA